MKKLCECDGKRGQKREEEKKNSYIEMDEKAVSLNEYSM